MIRQFCGIVALAIGATAAIAASAADKYPSRPVRLVVPYAPGGGSDTTARVIGQKLGERLGQTFVIDTRPGAASMIGTEIVAKAQGDGYTLILADVPHAINAVIFAKPPYDAVRDFAPIMRIATAPQVLVAHPSFGASSLKELIAMPRAPELPDVRERFASLALDIAPLGPDEFRKLIESDVKRWTEVVRKSGVKLN